MSKINDLERQLNAEKRRAALENALEAERELPNPLRQASVEFVALDPFKDERAELTNETRAYYADLLKFQQTTHAALAALEQRRESLDARGGKLADQVTAWFARRGFKIERLDLRAFAPEASNAGDLPAPGGKIDPDNWPNLEVHANHAPKIRAMP
jgi:hypothetical protein